MRSRLGLAVALLALATPGFAGRWDFLPWVDGDHEGFRDEGTPIDMRLHLKVGGDSHEVDDSAQGLDEARAILARVFPGTDRDGNTRLDESQVYQLLQELLEDGGNHGEALRIAGLNRRKYFDVNLVLDDHTEPLTPGAVLDVPKRCRFWVLGCTSSYTVKEGDTVASVAEEYGLSEDELRERNKRQLEIHPHARHEGNIRAVYMGEAGLGNRSDDFGTFLHELGHVGDETSCGAGYGPDGSHRMSEILPPASAFTEGWAQYQAAHRDPRRQGILAAPPALTLEVEAAAEEDEDAGPARYVTVEDGDRTLNDYLGNEARVGSILAALEELPPGREGVEAVFLETREDCRSIAVIVGAFLGAHPELATEVEGLLREWTDDVGSDRDYQLLMAGILPRCLSPRDLPRSRDYQPGSTVASGRSTGGAIGSLGKAAGKVFGTAGMAGGAGKGRPEGAEVTGGSFGGSGGLFGITPASSAAMEEAPPPEPERRAPVVLDLTRCDS